MKAVRNINLALFQFILCLILLLCYVQISEGRNYQGYQRNSNRGHFQNNNRGDVNPTAFSIQDKFKNTEKQSVVARLEKQSDFLEDMMQGNSFDQLSEDSSFKVESSYPSAEDWKDPQEPRQIIYKDVPVYNDVPVYVHESQIHTQVREASAPIRVYESSPSPVHIREAPPVHVREGPPVFMHESSGPMGVQMMTQTYVEWDETEAVAAPPPKIHHRIPLPSVFDELEYIVKSDELEHNIKCHEDPTYIHDVNFHDCNCPAMMAAAPIQFLETGEVEEKRKYTGVFPWWLVPLILLGLILIGK